MAGGLEELAARRAADQPPRASSKLHRARPPGALPGKRFFELCTQCNDCVAACPAWAIGKSAAHEPHPGYPYVEPNRTPCAMCDDPLPCIAACTTRALLPTPRTAIRFGRAQLDATRCVVPMGEPCEFCVQHCPVAEAAIRMTEQGPMIVEAGCTGCALCVIVCPEDALHVVAD